MSISGGFLRPIPQPPLDHKLKPKGLQWGDGSAGAHTVAAAAGEDDVLRNKVGVDGVGASGKMSSESMSM